MMLTNEQEQLFRNQGFIVFKNLLQTSEVEHINAKLQELWKQEGNEAGEENPYAEAGVRRLANLLDKGTIFKILALHPLLLNAVCSVLGPEFYLAMLNVRDVLPTAGSQRQNFHCDIEPHHNGGLPDTKGFMSCTAIWMMTSSTVNNGATRLIPGTHLSKQRPENVLGDRTAPHPDEIVVEGCAGDLLIMNGHCWHCGGSNQTSNNRCAILAHYHRIDCPCDDWMIPVLSPEVKEKFSSYELMTLGITT